MKTRVLVPLMAALALSAALAAPALAAPLHLHCVTTPGGNLVTLAQGVTLHAPHDPAFHNFHENVHLGVFAAGTTPLTIAVDLTVPYTCPPSP